MSRAIIIDYIWIDKCYSIRSWIKCCHTKTSIGSWTMDTFLISDEDSYIKLKPVKIFIDPFKRYNYYLVLCEIYNYDNTPYISNNRCNYISQLNLAKSLNIWFVMEQTCLFTSKDGLNPIYGTSKFGTNCPSGKTYGIEIVNQCVQKCLECGVKLNRIVSVIDQSQWTFRIGPIYGEDISDYMWILRYIITIIADQYNLNVYFHPQPINKKTGAESKKWSDNYGLIYSGTNEFRRLDYFTAVYNQLSQAKYKYFVIAEKNEECYDTPVTLEPTIDPNPNPEPTSDPNPEPTSNPNPEPTSDPNPEPAIDPNPEPTSDPNPNPNPEPAIDPNPNPEPTSDPNPNPEPTSDPNPEPASDPNPEPAIDPNPEPTIDPNPEPAIDPNPNPNPEPTSDPNPNPEPTSDPNPEPTSDPNPEPASDPNPEPAIDPNPEPTIDPNPEPASTSNTESDNIESKKIFKEVNDNSSNELDDLSFKEVTDNSSNELDDLSFKEVNDNSSNESDNLKKTKVNISREKMEKIRKQYTTGGLRNSIKTPLTADYIRSQYTNNITNTPSTTNKK
jgi:hypothetical protein